MQQQRKEWTSVVCDIGFSSMKMGLSGEDFPSCVIPTAVGYNPEDQSFHLEEEMEKYNEHMQIASPFENGCIVDWEITEKLIERGMERLGNPKATPFLLSEKPYNPPTCRMKAAELLFEKFDVESMFMSKDSVLSLYSTGRVKGCVVDLGGGSTVVSTVLNGYVQKDSIQKSDIGGDYLSKRLMEKMMKQDRSLRITPRFAIKAAAAGFKTLKVHPSFREFWKMEIFRDIKENLCKVDTSTGRSGSTPYELPDGSLIHVDAPKYSVPELLMDPSELQDEGLIPLADMVWRSINCAPSSETKALWQSGVVVTGGGSLMTGLQERLTSDISEILRQNNVKIPKMKLANTGVAQERQFSAWLGGSILGSLPNSSHQFQSMWISKKEYEECGSAIVEEKCP
eukprot:TRINITY_DN773086_c0_g1_i1.p1 TRINITY_DN773086_c0_g1~~TRINITY_DN773086_c0_g1_i1.p1  ORF type:complete len:397 (-),score=116.19 TRINITY_DN773086_c0_g1_i1:176-1366(-)